MKIAILTLTKRGKILGESIFEELTEDSTVIKLEIFHKNVKKNIEQTFNNFDCIIGIMATGIMIRNICPFIQNKKSDPAVLVIDERGKHVISLLSGHLGGANKLTLKISNMIGSDPVITTSTDLNHKFGVDCIANKYHFIIEPTSEIKSINTDLINNETVRIDYNSNYEYLWYDNEIQETYQRGLSDSNKLLVTNGTISLELIPKKIVVGVGSKKNITTQQVIKAINSAMKTLDLPVDRIDEIITGEMKKNEQGIIEAAKNLQMPLKIISESDLKNYKNPDLNNSDFVRSKFGLGGVCEPSSLIAAGEDAILIFRKTAYDGVTIAVSLTN